MQASPAPVNLDRIEAELRAFASSLPIASSPGAEPRTRYKTDKYQRDQKQRDLSTIPRQSVGGAPTPAELADTPHLSASERLTIARRHPDCPARIRQCGRFAFSGFPEITQTRTPRRTLDPAAFVTAPGCALASVPELPAVTTGGFAGLSQCGHRWCPYCGPRALSDDAQKKALALEAMAAEGWRVALAVLTLPHRAGTPEAALVAALHDGMGAVAATLDAWRTPEAAAAKRDLYRAQRNAATETQKGELRATIRSGSILWHARTELTLGKHGLHPHLNILLLIPPSASPATKRLAQGIYEGAERVDDRAHLPSLEAALWGAWMPSVLRALRAHDPVRAARYRAPDERLDDEVSQAQARVEAAADDCAAASPLDAPRAQRALAGAILDHARALDGAPARRAELRRRAVSVIAWEGRVGVAARYALGLGGGAAPSDWSAASEWAGPGKANDLWRALDRADWAPRWARWCLASEGARLTRASAGLVTYLDQRAEDEAAAAPVEPPPETLSLAIVHPLIVQWARDQHTAPALAAAAAAGRRGLARYVCTDLPSALVPLVYLRPSASPLDADPEGDAIIRAELTRAHADSGLGWGYWIGADGRPLTWIDSAGAERRDRPPADPAAILAARAARQLQAAARHAAKHHHPTPADCARAIAGAALAAAYAEGDDPADMADMAPNPQEESPL